jgi:D-arabinose 1-dehydrogenase-like Zn-dependent alcohol dehydrogenase
MKAAVINAPNAEVRIEERDRPSPSHGEVLIRVHACGVCHGDLMLQMGQFPFARYPVVPGHEIAGVIEEVGELRSGDRVGLSALFPPAAAASNASIGTSFFVLKCNLPASRKTAGINNSCSRLLLTSPSFRMR